MADLPDRLMQISASSINSTGKVPTISSDNSTQGVKHCRLGIQALKPADPDQVSVFGCTFLDNVVTVYDVGAAEVRFAALAV